jgi:hypothetical protein
MHSVVVAVHQAWKQPYATKGDFARSHANAVAVAAQEGLITTRITGDLYGGEWRPTAAGVEFLEELEKT